MDVKAFETEYRKVVEEAHFAKGVWRMSMVMTCVVCCVLAIVSSAVIQHHLPFASAMTST